MKKTFGVFINFGTELNNFYYTSFINQLLQKNNVIIITTQTNTEVLSFLKETNINVISVEQQNIKNNFIENLFLTSRRARLRINGINPFGWQGNTRTIETKDYFTGNIFIYSILKFIYLKLIKKIYNDNLVKNILLEYNITDVLMQSYANLEAIKFGITANYLKKNVWLLNWGWKDFYTNELLPFQVKGFFTWNKYYKTLYSKFNTHINPNNIYAIGSPNFDAFYCYKPLNYLDYYLNKYNFSKNIESKIILITLINPTVFNNEIPILIDLINYINKKNKDFLFLIKPNPMQTDFIKLNELNQFKNVRIIKNNWIYVKDTNFNCTTKDAKTEWLDLLYYSKVTINVASTVTIESLLMKKPVININYGTNKEETKFIQKFTNAPYYKNLLTRNDIFVANSKEEIFDSLNLISNNQIKVEKPITDILENTSNVTTKIIKIIDEYPISL